MFEYNFIYQALRLQKKRALPALLAKAPSHQQ
jgi:hypothetical protein